jgi:hypothetical protein
LPCNPHEIIHPFDGSRGVHLQRCSMRRAKDAKFVVMRHWDGIIVLEMGKISATV